MAPKMGKGSQVKGKRGEVEFYYHITRPKNVPSIIATGLKRKPGKPVFFGKTVDDCIQLAPVCGGFFHAKMYLEQLHLSPGTSTISIDVALLTVDLKGLTDKLQSNKNVRVKDAAEGKGIIYTNEYRLYDDVPAEKIVCVDTITLSMGVHPNAIWIAEELLEGLR